jgi:hypothetical protein
MPVETYNSIEKVKRYYAFLRQAYEIIYDKLRDTNTEMNL